MASELPPPGVGRGSWTLVHAEAVSRQGWASQFSKTLTQVGSSLNSGLGSEPARRPVQLTPASKYRRGRGLGRPAHSPPCPAPAEFGREVGVGVRAESGMVLDIPELFDPGNREIIDTRDDR